MKPVLQPADMITVTAMRNDGWHITEIAAHYGVDRKTIHRFMDQWGIPRGRPGPRTHCLRNHELTDDNTYVFPDGRRECRICKRLRDSAHKRRKYWEGKEEERE